MEILIFLCGSLVGAVIVGFAMLHVIENNNTYSGGHAVVFIIRKVGKNKKWEYLEKIINMKQKKEDKTS